MVDESRPQARVELQDSPQLRGPARFDPVVSTGVRRPLRRTHVVDAHGFVESTVPGGATPRYHVERGEAPPLMLGPNWPMADPTARPIDEHPSTHVRPEGIPGAAV